MAIKPKLQSLLASANDVTGEERTNLTDAMQDLVDGYGQGGVDIISSAGSSSINAISNGISYFAQNYADSTRTYHGQFYSNATTPLSLNLSSAQSWRYVFKIKITDTASVIRGIYGNPNAQSTAYGPFCQVNTSNKIGCGFSTTTVYDWAKWMTKDNAVMSLNAWYYIVQGWDNGKGYLMLYDENGDVVAGTCAYVSNWHNHNFNVTYGGSRAGSNNNWLLKNGEINLNETFIEVDGTCVWGTTNSKTVNMKFDFSNPAEFTKVDYLIADGTQYINTGINPSNSLRLKRKCMRGTVGTDVYHMFGGRPSGGSGMYELYLSTDMNFRSDYGSTWGTITSYTDIGDYITIDKDGRTTTVNNVTVTAPSETFSSNFPVYLFNWNNGGAIMQSTSERMIIDCEMYQSGVLARNFISVYHTATGVRGMFDSANNLFYLNAGTGDFGIPSDTSGEINLAEYLASLT